VCRTDSQPTEPPDCECDIRRCTEGRVGVLLTCTGGIHGVERFEGTRELGDFREDLSCRRVSLTALETPASPWHHTSHLS